MERNELAHGAGVTANVSEPDGSAVFPGRRSGGLEDGWRPAASRGELDSARKYLPRERDDSRRFGRGGESGARPTGAMDSAICQSRDVLIQVLVECDSDLGEHSLDVAVLAEATASRLNLDDERKRQVRLAAELHDVGKLAISDGILEKPRPLSRGERVAVERHTLVGERILAAAPGLRGIAKIVRSSHEWVDGTGYPDRLLATEIPIESRVIGVCDAYHAMVSDRPYRRAMTAEAAIAELQRSAGSQFDREVVEVLCGLVSEAEGQAAP